MDTRLKNLAEQLDAGLIARREFLRKAAVITGGTAAGLHALRGMAPAQAKTKLRVWLFKSFVTAGNDVLAKQVEAWAKEKNVEVEMDWAHLRRSRAEVRGRHRGGQSTRPRRDEHLRADALQGGIARREQGGRGDRGGQGRAPALRRAGHEGRRQVPRRRALLNDRRVLHPQGHHGGQGPQGAQGLRSRRGRVRQEGAGPGQGSVRLRPDPEPVGRRRRLHVHHPLELRRGRVGQGRQARAGQQPSSSRTPRRSSSRWTRSRSTGSSLRASWAGPTCPTTSPTWRASW